MNLSKYLIKYCKHMAWIHISRFKKGNDTFCRKNKKGKSRSYSESTESSRTSWSRDALQKTKFHKFHIWCISRVLSCQERSRDGWVKGESSVTCTAMWGWSGEIGYLQISQISKFSEFSGTGTAKNSVTSSNSIHLSSVLEETARVGFELVLVGPSVDIAEFEGRGISINIFS